MKPKYREVVTPREPKTNRVQKESGKRRPQKTRLEPVVEEPEHRQALTLKQCGKLKSTRIRETSYMYNVPSEEYTDHVSPKGEEELSGSPKPDENS